MSDSCPECGGELKLEEKDTSSGRDIREYRCAKCGKAVAVDGGAAVWKALHDENERKEKP